MWVRIKQPKMEVICINISGYQSFTIDRDVDEDGELLKTYSLVGMKAAENSLHCTALTSGTSSACHAVLNKLLALLKIDCLDL